MMLMILGALGVRTQQPSPYLTGPFVNGVMWREYSQTKKVSFVIGAVDGFIAAVYQVARILPQQGDCKRSVEAAIPNWVHSSNATAEDVAKEMDSFYQDGANISLPMIDAVEYSEMKLAGATKKELDEHLTRYREAIVK